MPAQVLQQILTPEQKTNKSLQQNLLNQGAGASSAEQDKQQQQQLAAGQLPPGSSSSTGGAGSNILPYGPTLHYPGCSCPSGWQPGSRVADRVDELVAKAHGLYQQGLIAPQRKLRVCYMLPHHNITGGMKCLVEHIRLLRERGHYTIAVHRSDTATRAMPPWTPIEADADVVCNLHQRLSDVYPVNSIDVVLVGIFHQVAELLAGVPAPVVYWEQGHEWLFGDPVRLQVAQNYLKQDQLFHTILHLPVVLTAVSSAVQDILQQEFGRSSLLIPNGIDCERFQPGPYQPLDGSGSTAEDSSNQALGTAAAVMTGPVTAAGASAAEDCSGSGQAMAEAPLGPGDGILSTDAPADAGAVGPDADAGVEGSAVMAAASSLELLAAAAAAVAEDAAEAAPMEVTELQPAAAADPTEAPAQDPQAATSYANDHQNPCMLVSLNPAGRMPAVQKKRVLLVGNPALPLKGFPAAIAALTAVSAVLPVKVRWVCQVAPTAAMIPGLQGAGLDLETVVSPSQGELPGLYKGHDVFLFTSRYEAWGMPVLEAMATGLPVVTTDCLGVRTFCRHGENCLIGLPDDVAGLAQHLLLVLTEPALAAKLSAASRETALQYTPERVTEQLEAVLYCLTAIGPELLQLRRSCLLELQQACARASEACSRPSAAAQQLQRQRQLALQQLLTHSRQQQVLQHYQLQSLNVLEQLELAVPQQVGQLQQQLQHLQQQEAAPPLQISGLMPFLLQQQQQQQQQQSALLALLQSSSRDAQQLPAASILQQQQQLSQQLSQQLQLPTSLLMLQQQQQQPLQLSQQQQVPSSYLMLQQQQLAPQFQQLQHSQQQQQLTPRLQLPVLSVESCVLGAPQHALPSPSQVPASLQLVLQHLQGHQQQPQQQHDLLRMQLAHSQQPLQQQQQQLLMSLQQPVQQMQLQPSLLAPQHTPQQQPQPQPYLHLQQQQPQQQGQQQQVPQLFTLFS